MVPIRSTEPAPLLPAPTLQQLYLLEDGPFLRAAYLALLGRPADEEGQAHYALRLAAGDSRIAILRDLQRSMEGQAAGRALPGLAAPTGGWRHVPVLGGLIARYLDRTLDQRLALQALRLDGTTAIARLSAQLDALQTEVARRLRELQDETVMCAGEAFTREHWEAVSALLSLRADRFVDEAFDFVLQRAPQQHEMEHFRHLQTLGLGSHTLLASLLRAPEAVARRAAGAKPPAPLPAMPAASVPHAASAISDGSSVVTVDDELLLVDFRTKGEPLVSVIIPVHGKLEYTLMCLRSIVRNRPRSSFEVIVVDDRSPDNTASELQRLLGLRLVINEVNLGFVRSCNRGAAAAHGRYVYFLNNDTEVKPGWLDNLVETYAEFPDAGLIGSKLVFPDGSLQEAGGIVWKDASAWNYGRGQDPSRSVFNYARETDYCSGASILIEKKLFEELGRFDERFVPAYCEDTSLAFAVRAAGKQVIYQPKSEIVHYEGISHGTSTASGIKAYQVVNQKKFYELWRDVLDREHFPNAEHVPLARDRAARKRIVLVVDHYVPQPDRDAGSRTMWQFIRMFQAHGMIVKFWPENLWYDPVYTPMLERAGVEVFYGAEYAGRFDDWIRDNGAYIDTVLLSRPHISVNFTDAIRCHSRAHVLYYGHDLHHQRLRRQLALKYDQRTQDAMEEVERQEKKVWTQVDTIFYPAADETDVVERWLRAHGEPARARTIPVYAFDSFPAQPWERLEQRHDLLFVAGFGHPPNAGAAVWFVEDVLPRIQARRPEVRINLVGSNPTEDVKRLARDGVTVTGYVSDDDLADYYAQARVAVAPLLYGGGMKGKVVEAMRFGLPCVTSLAGAQGLEEATSFLAVAKDADSFATEVLRLLEDDLLWLQRSRAAQAFAQERFSVEALWRIVSDRIATTPYSHRDERFARKHAKEAA